MNFNGEVLLIVMIFILKILTEFNFLDTY